MRFKNITCESKDASTISVAYCFVGSLNVHENYISLRYSLLKNETVDKLVLQVQLMRKVSTWNPYLYAIKIDMCKFWKHRYNYLAKLIISFLDGHTNMNHSCPYKNETYLTIDNVTNIEVSEKIAHLPLPKGRYALHTTFQANNVTRAQTNIFFEMI
ncbi:uncharacterized protein LOC115624682 [Scaptodrosophila lebanonensis]|uniref:Uncharacterized protein LOC115624682 n=1 Tax=Drosophila lebanonensis TaxID=7225 RepID=A0A6J2TF56_DROLE|nr:uncharacterized protein LOC115624682 [Scaptodrosophila lebanonensis]